MRDNQIDHAGLGPNKVNGARIELSLSAVPFAPQLAARARLPLSYCGRPPAPLRSALDAGAVTKRPSRGLCRPTASLATTAAVDAFDVIAHGRHVTSA